MSEARVRGVNRTMPNCDVIPVLVYDDVPAAIDWLCDTFGLVDRWRVGDHRAVGDTSPPRPHPG